VTTPQQEHADAVQLTKSEAANLPLHLAFAHSGEWVEIPGLGWLIEVAPPGRAGGDGIDFWWWHDCPPLREQPSWKSVRRIDTSSGERHAILSGSLADGDLTIGGGSGSIPCDKCGLHGWVRDGKWVAA
jgi:hypothetical protein